MLNTLNPILLHGLKAFDIYGQALSQWLEDNPSNLARPQKNLSEQYLGIEKEKFMDLHAASTGCPRSRAPYTFVFFYVSYFIRYG